MNDITIAIEPITANAAISRRQAEKDTVARILARLLPPGTTLNHTSDGAPFLEKCDTQISISHSRSRAAVALNPHGPIGIDIEDNATRCARVIERVTTEAERALPSRVDPLTAWTVKEAVFKAAGIPDLTIGEITVMPDGSATARGHRFRWRRHALGIAIAVPET